MKISTEINSIARHIGEEKTVELVAKAGFDAWDFSMFNMVKYDWKTKTLLETSHPLGSNEYVQVITITKYLVYILCCYRSIGVLHLMPSIV